MINSDLVYKNNEIFANMKNNYITKRVKKEVAILYELFDDVKVSFTEDGFLKITVNEINENKIYKYEFILIQHYPFISPKIYYQNKPYADYLRVYYSKHNFNIFRKITGKDCFCCSSYNCPYNWNPGVNIKKIIEEICKIRQAKRNVINKIIADKIKEKYLLDDINLDCWLF
jgi:hypothetical protein